MYFWTEPLGAQTTETKPRIITTDVRKSLLANCMLNCDSRAYSQLPQGFVAHRRVFIRIDAHRLQENNCLAMPIDFA